MFVPLGDYHSGGTDATFDGFERELEWAFAQVSVPLRNTSAVALRSHIGPRLTVRRKALSRTL